MNEHVCHMVPVVLRESMLCSRWHKVVPERLLGAKYASNSGSANLLGETLLETVKKLPRCEIVH